MLWPRCGVIRSWLQPHHKFIPTIQCTQNNLTDPFYTSQNNIIGNVQNTHNIAVAGPGPGLRLLPLPEVAHDVVQVLAHQLLHPLQPGQSLRREINKSEKLSQPST